MTHNMREGVWSFYTKRFAVKLTIEQVLGYRYDGDDEDGEIQRKLDYGEYIAFDSVVTVYLDDAAIGYDYLGSSVYESGKESEFWTAHRDANPANRNCTANTYRVGHYFPDMVKTACAEARKALNDRPRLRGQACGS